MRKFKLKKFIEFDKYFNKKNLLIIFTLVLIVYTIILSFFTKFVYHDYLLIPPISLLVGFGVVENFFGVHFTRKFKKLVGRKKLIETFECIGALVGLVVGCIISMALWMLNIIISALIPSIAITVLVIIIYLFFRFLNKDRQPEVVSAYIDGNNLHQGILSSKWELDYTKFRIFLEDKYKVNHVFIFIGWIKDNQKMYSDLKARGFELIFKEVTKSKDGKIKGNCDSELVQRAMQDFYEKNANKFIIVSSDGDYAVLLKFLKEKNSLISVLSPYERLSYLIRKLDLSVVYLNEFKCKLKKRKAPDEDNTS